MAIHVDVVKNEWLAGYQVVVAQAYVENGEVQIQSPDRDKWEGVVLNPIHILEHDEYIHPSKTPDQFLEKMSEAISGTYLFATEPHEVADCPYAQNPMVPMEQVKAIAPIKKPTSVL